MKEIIEVAIYATTLSLFIEKLFDDEMLLRRYYLLLNYLWVLWKGKNKGRGRLASVVRAVKRQLLKPLGLCIYCYGTWVYIMLYVIINGIDLGVIVGLGINYLLLEVLINIKERWLA